MAKLYFNFSVMNAGKSSNLLQSAHNYKETGKHVLYFNSAIDTRYGENMISSRIGISHDAVTYDDDTNFYHHLLYLMDKPHPVDRTPLPSAIFIDEAQFLTKEHVLQLCEIVDVLQITVLCYGIRNDYMGNLFEGSAALLCNADEINEITGMCSHPDCTRKATHILRYQDGELQTEGNQKIVGDQEYVSVCRFHFMDSMKKYH